MLIYSSSLGTETQKPKCLITNMPHSNLTLTQHKLCRMVNPPFYQPAMTACPEHSLEPAKQERSTPRRTGSSSPERALLCRPIKKGFRDYLCQLPKPQTTTSPPSEALACCSVQSWSKICWHPDHRLWGPTHPSWSPSIPYHRLADPLPGQQQKLGCICLQVWHPSVSPSPCSSNPGCSLPTLLGPLIPRGR